MTRTQQNNNTGVDTDNGAADPYGDTCAGYNSFPSWCGNYDDDDFISGEMCCVCGGGVTNPHRTAISWEHENSPLDSITATWEGGVSEAGGSVFFAWSRGAWDMDSADWDTKQGAAYPGHL